MNGAARGLAATLNRLAKMTHASLLCQYALGEIDHACFQRRARACRRRLQEGLGPRAERFPQTDGRQGGHRAGVRDHARPGGTLRSRRLSSAVATPDGGRIAYERVELSKCLMDRAWLASFAPGTVGAAYAEFTARENLSAEGLAEESRKTTTGL